MDLEFWGYLNPQLANRRSAIAVTALSLKAGLVKRITTLEVTMFEQLFLVAAFVE